MATVRYRVPYEIACNALDVGSGRRVSNIIYVRTALSAGPAPAYGDPVAGSDNAVLLASIVTAWNANIHGILNQNYAQSNFTMRAILGKQYKTPFQTIMALLPGAPIIIQTTSPHGLVTGNSVYVQGVTSPPAANGVWGITVITTDSFSLTGSNSALLWSGDGQFQLATGAYQFAYADKVVQISATFGAIVGDALPLFSCASIRRNNAGIGKSFRSRLSMSPMSESDSLDGGLLPARITAINAAFAGFNDFYANGGTDAGAGQSANIAVSKKIASTLPLIFPNSDAWAKGNVTFSVQRNLGSLVRRKPRLTSIIT
jgi:hypothetical protein